MSHAAQFDRDARKKAFDLRHRAVINKATTTYSTTVAKTKAAFLDWEFGRQNIRQRKWEAINHLDRYLEEFEKNARERGTIVHYAKDAPHARTIVLDLCRAKNVRKLVKSKSMLTEEIHLNEFLEEHGVKPVETDLGEYIVQIRKEKPYHIVTPVMHLTKEDIDQTFHELLGSPLGSSAEDLTAIARKELRQEYLTADMGITGANFVVAETGMISLTENEGNARLSVSLPRIHVVICGIEKVIPKLSDIPNFIPMLAVSGTGQQVSCYNTLVGGPRQPGETDGPEEMHVIFLDNERSRVLANAEQREILHCIRCGACLNACPVFRTIGGHAYGTTYQGPIGSVLTPLLRGYPGWKHLSYGSSLCGACTQMCPANIHLHHHLLKNRRNAVNSGAGKWYEKILFIGWSMVMRCPFIYGFGNFFGRMGQKMMRLLRIEGTILDPAQNWSKTRAVGTIAGKSFHAWWRERQEVNGHYKTSRPESHS
ncbi:MAG: LutB/LldF family L-lactate oxidation iron-sulfur protein [Verrucomicrobiae bacterium]|nr:LutB/LldF family L-lactate oxidation iron-sulfur protein [Verrucomicrobiae bacterium]